MKLTIEKFAYIADKMEAIYKYKGIELGESEVLELLKTNGLTKEEWYEEFGEALNEGLCFRIPNNRFDRLASKFEELFEKNMTSPVTEQKRLNLQIQWKEALVAESVTEKQWLMEINRKLQDQEKLRDELKDLRGRTS